MLFRATHLADAYLIEPEKHSDERGFFARVWCNEELEARGLRHEWVQSSISFNTHRGTLRGMHYQMHPYEEEKLVTCIRGSVFDVIVDLRPDSETRLQWYGVELNERNDLTLYIPKGFAHGFLTLEPSSVVQYHMSEPYEPNAAAGVRWNDPALGIQWPEEPSVISERDSSYPDFMASR